MDEVKDITTQKHLSFKEILAYSLGLFGFQAIVGLLNSYQAEFDGSILGVDIAVVGILILVAKIISAVADPIVGGMVDRSKSKLGKFKGMIAYSILPLLVMSAVVFIDVPFKNNTMLTYVWIFVTYLIWSIAMTMGDVPSQGIAAALTPNPTERTNVVSISNTAKQIGFSACVVIVPIVCLIIPEGSKVIVKKGETDTPMIGSEYFWVAVLTAVLGCALFALIPLINKERVITESSEKIGMKDMFRALKENKPLMLVIVSYFLGFGRQMAMGIQVQAANVLLGSQNLVAVLGIVTAIGSMISMAICPVLIKKFNEKKVYLIMSIYGFIASVLSFIVGHFWFKACTTSEDWFKGGNAVLTILFFASLFLIGLQFGAVTLMPMIMTADCVDYYEYETGKRMEGTAYSILTLTIKVCLALGVALGLVFVGISGYSDTLNAIKDGTATGFESKTKDIIFFAYTVMPGILALLSIIPMFKYDIVGEKKEKISKALAQRRATEE
ncbi:MAG: MFS transporter [Eubacterium sp.]|nr:MFS transporter [Eubacterium sp.]